MFFNYFYIFNCTMKIQMYYNKKRLQYALEVPKNFKNPLILKKN